MGEGLDEKQVRDDANDLVNAVVTYARRMLVKYGEFGPIGFSLARDRKLNNETVARQDMPADPALLLDLLEQQLTERAGRQEIIAAAAGANVTLDKPSAEGYTDAVLIEVEHQTGYSIKAFVPYKMGGGQLHNLLPRIVRFGKILIQDGAKRWFAQR